MIYLRSQTIHPSDILFIWNQVQFSLEFHIYLFRTLGHLSAKRCLLWNQILNSFAFWYDNIVGIAFVPAHLSLYLLYFWIANTIYHYGFQYTFTFDFKLYLFSHFHQNLWFFDFGYFSLSFHSSPWCIHHILSSFTPHDILLSLRQIQYLFKLHLVPACESRVVWLLNQTLNFLCFRLFQDSDGMP